MRFRCYTDLHGMWRWRLMRFDQVIAVSFNGFSSKAKCLAMIEEMQSSISNSTVEDISGLSAPPPPRQ